MPWSKLGNLSPPPPSGSSVPVWTRPADWLALPAVSAGQQKLVGLFAVHPYEGANFVSMIVSGSYTVDWGDGTAVENVASGIQANHKFDYATIPTGSASTRGYRQVIVTVTPQAGQSLTAVNLARKNPQGSTQNNCTTGWLDIRMAGASVSSMSPSVEGAQVVAALLEQFEYVGPSAMTSLSYFFQACSNLQSIKGSQWTSGVTDVGNMLYGCASMRVLADLNFSAVPDATNLFTGNKVLQRVSGLNLSGAASAASMFSGCTALQEAADLNLSAATSLSLMFNGCSVLTSVSGITASLATDLGSVFSGCVSLQTVKGLVTPKGASFASMFNGCLTLRTVDVFDTSQATAMNSMFANCSNLQTVPAFNTVKCANFSSMFSSCRALLTLPALNMAAATSVTSFVASCPALSGVGVTGLKVACDFTGCRMSSTALNTLYTNLGTVSGLAVNVTNNYGVAGDNPAIATAKGWTVTGT